jgi:hypothetical protein
MSYIVPSVVVHACNLWYSEYGENDITVLGPAWEKVSEGLSQKQNKPYGGIHL